MQATGARIDVEWTKGRPWLDAAHCGDSHRRRPSDLSSQACGNCSTPSPISEWFGEALGGREAIELARSLQPDVLLLDLAMPRISGLDVLRAAHLGRSRARGVVLLTASIDRDDIVVGACGWAPPACC